MTVSTLNACPLPWMIMNTLKTEITPPIQLAMSYDRRAITKVLMSRLGIINIHLRRDFIAINAAIHSGATDKCTNLSTSYIEPANSSK